jgi:hypothetical protein
MVAEGYDIASIWSFTSQYVPLPYRGSMRPNARSRLHEALVDRGYGGVVVYGTEEDPVVDVGLVPDDILWSAYHEAMPKSTPCRSCFMDGSGLACLANECPNA